MPAYHESIIVEVPRERVYAYWTRFEEFPSFMCDVSEVRRLGSGRLAWRGHGDDATWETELTDVIDGQSIAWQSTSHPQIREAVELFGLGGGRTLVKVTYTVEREKGDLGELVRGMLGAEPATLRANLEQFKRHVELQEAMRGAGERAVGATADAGAAVARGEAPGPGPATGLAEARGATSGGGPAAVTAAPDPLPPGLSDGMRSGHGAASSGAVGQTGDRKRAPDDDEEPRAP